MSFSLPENKPNLQMCAFSLIVVVHTTNRNATEYTCENDSLDQTLIAIGLQFIFVCFFSHSSEPQWSNPQTTMPNDMALFKPSCGLHYLFKVCFSSTVEQVRFSPTVEHMANHYVFKVCFSPTVEHMANHYVC